MHASAAFIFIFRRQFPTASREADFAGIFQSIYIQVEARVALRVKRQNNGWTN